MKSKRKDLIMYMVENGHAPIGWYAVRFHLGRSHGDITWYTKKMWDELGACIPKKDYVLMHADVEWSDREFSKMRGGTKDNG